MDIQVIILAAGKGSRMKSPLPKVLHQLAGKPLVQHVVDTCHVLGARQCSLVVGHGAEQVISAVDQNPMTIRLVEQAEQLGTGHAVKLGVEDIPDPSVSLILYGDVPLIQASSLKRLVETYQNSNQGIALITCHLDDPTGYGRIIRNLQGEVVGIVEHKDASASQRNITEINTGILCCSTGKLKNWVNRLNNDNSQGEYYLTDIISMAVGDGDQVLACQPAHLFEVEGVNTLRQLADLERRWQLEQAYRLMEQGVTLRDPNRFDLRGSLSCEPGVIIDVNCVFEGQVTLKQGAVVGANCYLKDSSLGENSVVKPNSVVEGATIGSSASVGPFARLRPGAVLENDSHVGNFVEIKQSKLGEGSKAGHLAYIGDADIGKNVNIGAGTITCNYDGANKHKTIIEDGAFIGSDTQLVAPVVVGKNVTVGAGTTVTSSIEDNALCISRVRQKHIANWKRPQKHKKD